MDRPTQKCAWGTYVHGIGWEMPSIGRISKADATGQLEWCSIMCKGSHAMHSGRLDSPADRQLGEPVARKCMHEDGRDRQHGNDAMPPVSVAVEGQTAAS
jgi:hypothetical protein